MPGIKATKATKAANTTNTAKKSTTKGGVNLAPLVSALLLAGIKLSLAHNEYSAKRKSPKTKKSKTKSTPATSTTI